MTLLVHEPRALFAACEGFRAAGVRVGLVPTMGALHAGHSSLVQAVRAAGAARVVLSIFVNPLQFGPSEDFGKYPRTLEQDLARCREHGVDVVYAPSFDAMYGEAFQTHVEVERVSLELEGAVRPTHFRGVTTVVLKLFNAVGPCIAAFGRKDYQQWRVIARMVQDLDVPVEVLGCPIVREPDGLALSSRNRHLSGEQREHATAIFAGLCDADRAYRAGERDTSKLEGLVREHVAKSFEAIDYITLAGADDLQPCGDRAEGRAVMLVAARLGATRLLDNHVLGEGPSLD